MHDKPPKYSIYGRKWTFEGQGWSPDPPCLTAPLLLVWSEIWKEQHQIYVSLFGNLYISKLILKKKWKKNMWN